MATPNTDFTQAENKHDPDPDPDPEAGNLRKRKLTRTTKFKIVSLQPFLELFQRIHSRPIRRVVHEEARVYKRLMDDLDDEEDPPSWYTKLFVLLEIVVLLGLVAALVATVRADRIRRRELLTLPAWQWVALAMVLLSGLSTVRFATFLVFAPVKWWWRVHKYVVYFVREIKWCVDVTLWFGLVLVAWYLWFRPRLRHVKGELSMVLARQTTRLLIALVLGSFLWLLKNLLYLKLKADLHYDELYDRIRHTVLDFHGIQIIYKEGMWNFLTSDKNKTKVNDYQNQAKEAEEEEKQDGKEKSRNMKGKNIWMDVCRMKKETVPIWILRRLSNTYLEQMKKVGLPRKRDATKDDRKLMSEAQQMLRQIVHEEERNHIISKDLDKYDLNMEERSYLFGMFEADEEKDERKEAPQQQEKRITRDQFLSWAVVAYKNCWGLERTLHSSERVFIKLNRIMSAFLLTVVLIIWLLLSTIVDTAQLALLFTPFLAASFIFGDTCKKMFEGLIFAFAMHPFDVGDRVVIDNVQMKVSQLNILTSVFFKYDTGEEVVYPNSLLASTKIINLDIIPDQADSLEFTILFSTPLEDITDLELKIKKALDDDLTYSSQTKVVKKEIGKEEIKMAIYFKYLVSYLAAETKAMHRSSILTKIMEFTKEIESNIGKGLSSTNEVEIVEFTLDSTVTLDQINDLKRNMFRDYESCKEHCKLLIKGLDKKQLEMALYLSVDSMDRDHLKEQLISEVERLKGTLKSHHQSSGAWSRRVSQVRSLGRTSEKEGSSNEPTSPTSINKQRSISSTCK